MNTRNTCMYFAPLACFIVFVFIHHDNHFQIFSETARTKAAPLLKLCQALHRTWSLGREKGQMADCVAVLD